MSRFFIIYHGRLEVSTAPLAVGRLTRSKFKEKKPPQGKKSKVEMEGKKSKSSKKSKK